VDECEVKEKDSGDPAVDGCIRLDVRVVEHSFDVLHIDFDNEIVDSDYPQVGGLEAAEQSIQFELWLEVVGLPLVEQDGPEAARISSLWFISIGLCEDIANSDIASVN